MTTTLKDTLQSRQIKLPKVQVEKLDEFCNLLWNWNEKINLTRHTTYEKFVCRDLQDSLELAGLLRQNERVLDVGTGGGVPGIVLAILRPDLKMELCDSTGKKTLALSEILRSMHLDMPVHHAKGADVLNEQGKRFTTLTVRAVSKLTQLLRHFAPCWSSFDRLLLVKGPNWIAERGEARHYNLMTKIALRCVKKYPSFISETENSESVILQLCLKENLKDLDKMIDEHKTERRQKSAGRRFFRKYD
ncbi:ribosomal RNA small subunit methyltransferase G [Planctomycetales bacterium]|nr:ribosomal RNA small subunit methyltransferase G [Planctomycetales bacterium]